MFNVIKKFGFILLIDDFGIGYLLLVYLVCFLIDEFKIDCVFISNIDILFK